MSLKRAKISKLNDLPVTQKIKAAANAGVGFGPI
jgi:hypothetical protein